MPFLWIGGAVSSAMVAVGSVVLAGIAVCTPALARVKRRKRGSDVDLGP